MQGNVGEDERSVVDGWEESHSGRVVATEDGGLHANPLQGAFLHHCVLLDGRCGYLVADAGDIQRRQLQRRRFDVLHGTFGAGAQGMRNSRNQRISQWQIDQ